MQNYRMSPDTGHPPDAEKALAVLQEFTAAHPEFRGTILTGDRGRYQLTAAARAAQPVAAKREARTTRLTGRFFGGGR